MANTTPKNIVYPTTMDDIDTLEAVFAALASSVDTALDSYVLTSNLATASEIEVGTSSSKVATAKSLKDAGIYAGDTGWVDISSNVSAGSGWTKDASFTAYARRVGNVVQLNIGRLNKTSSSPVNVGVSGNIANTLIISGIPTQFRPSQTSALAALGSGRSNSYYVNSSGAVYIAGFVPNANWTGTKPIPTGEAVSAGGTYFGA